VACVYGFTIGPIQSYSRCVASRLRGVLHRAPAAAHTRPPLRLSRLHPSCRSVFSTMVPRGRETAFFSLYELTNKGSSALGPLVMTAIQQATGELRYAWIFVITNIVSAAHPRVAERQPGLCTAVPARSLVLR